MTNRSEEENSIKIPVLWQVFRNEAMELKLLTGVIDRIKQKIKEKIDKNSKSY